MADDDELPWFPVWREEQRRLREMLGEDEPDLSAPAPTLTPEPRTLQ